MSEWRGAEFPQFEDRMLPCTGCGEMLRFPSTGELAGAWADDVVAPWCATCWIDKFGSPPVEGAGDGDH